ncbi:MAG TPA: hypothetical protein VKA35_04925 [Solirubrobacterales bacterium]|nr:hypothetical protein [Solirubrobacterales bacterium]
MKRIGAAIGLAVLGGVLYLSVFLGGAASATGGTTLCKKEESPCSAENHYGIGTSLVAYSTAAEFLTTNGNVVCEKSGFATESKTTTTGSNISSVQIKIGSYFFTGCSIRTPAVSHLCTVTVLNGPYTGTINHSIGTVNGTLSISSTGLGNMTAKVDCGATLLKCEFNFGTPILEAFGGSTWRYRANRVKLAGTSYEGGVCPKEATWYGWYNIAVSPSPLYIEDSA